MATNIIKVLVKHSPLMWSYVSEYICLPFASELILEHNPVDCTNKIELVKEFIGRTLSIKKIYLIRHWKSLLNHRSKILASNMNDIDPRKYNSFIRSGIEFTEAISITELEIIFFGIILILIFM